MKKLIIITATILLMGGIWVAFTNSVDTILESNLGANTNYYVSNFGDDSNDGLASSTAWATITKVNSVTFGEGDTIQFRCGDEFVGASLDVDDSGVEGNPITYTSYGDCVNNFLPLITNAWDYGSTTVVWIDTGANIWKTATDTFDTYVGQIWYDGRALDTPHGTTTEAKHELGDYIASGDYSTGIDDLDTNFEWWYDATNNLVVMYQDTGNPADEADDIWIPSYFESVINCNSNADWITIDGLAVMYGYDNLINIEGIPGNPAEGWVVQNNRVAYIGIDINSTPRGNGIGVYGTSDNIIIQNNDIWDAFDSPFTVQNWNDGNVITNILFDNNYVRKCGSCVEIQTYSAEGWPVASFDSLIIDGLYITNNIFDYQDGTWAKTHNQTGENAVHFVQHSNATITDVWIDNNDIFGFSPGKASDYGDGNGFRVVNVGSSTSEYGIEFTDIKISNNKIHDNTNKGIWFECSVCSNYVTSSVQIYNNFFYNNGDTRNEASQIWYYEYQDPIGWSEIFNNTIVNTTGDTSTLVFTSNSDALIANNYFFSNHGSSVTSTAAGTISGGYNLRYSSSSEFDNIGGWPLFENATSSAGALNFDITTSSPAFDAGLDAYHATTTDYYGNAKFNHAWDIGAHELQAVVAAVSSVINTILQAGTFQGGFTIK